MTVNLRKVAKRAAQYDYVLIVMRHAKTEFADEIADIDRQLLKKGRQQAKNAGKAIKRMNLIPDTIECSGAKRTRQTADCLLKVFGDDPDINYRAKLYGGGMQAYADRLARAKDKVRTMMIIGHEPDVSVCSCWLADPDSHKGRMDKLRLGFSPATFAVLGSDKPFNRWDLHEAQILGVITAKDCDE